MSDANDDGGFSIDDQKSFDENLVAFKKELAVSDPQLGPVLGAALAALAAGTLDRTMVWTSLHRNAAEVEADASDPREKKL